MTRVAWLGEALADLKGVRDYIARDNPAAARRVVSGIKDATAILQDHPGIGRPGRIDGTRELIPSLSVRRGLPASRCRRAGSGGGAYVAAMAGRIAVAVFCIEQVAWQVLARRLNDGLLARASVKVGVGGTAPLGRRSVDGVGWRHEIF